MYEGSVEKPFFLLAVPQLAFETVILGKLARESKINSNFELLRHFLVPWNTGCPTLCKGVP